MDPKLVWIGLGGMAGTIARYLVSGWVAGWAGPAFPWGTFTVNLVGSFLLAVLAHVGTTTTLLSPTARIALTTGVMGGFTTYSTFSLETWTLIEEGAWGVAGANVGLTVVGCLVGTALGFVFARSVIA